MGASGWGTHISDCEFDGGWPTVLDELYGPIDTDPTSRWYLGAERGATYTGELIGIIQAILWLKADGGHEPATIAFDSEYAAKVAQGIYKPKKNLHLAVLAQQGLR